MLCWLVASTGIVRVHRGGAVELLIVLGYIVVPLAAVRASFAFSGDTASSGGDGMILGCFLLAVPLWPLTMSLWLLYVLKRHADITSRGW
jgi:hypothetical protein